MAHVHSADLGLALSGSLTLQQISAFEEEFDQLLLQCPDLRISVDVAELTELDTAGAVFLLRLPQRSLRVGKEIELSPLPAHLQPFFDFVSRGAQEQPEPTRRTGLLEQLGGWIQEFNRQLAEFCFLASDLTWASLSAVFRPRGIRRGALVEQATAVGSSALPIVALILFLIGAVSSLQAAAQLRNFGADVLVAELLAIGITRELGPLMTAILIAGRSGSSISAEIATMKFTEEIDALQTMALDPLRFVAVPKMWAMLLCLPMLTIMADFVGILGGVFIGVVFMKIPPVAFFDQVLSALFLKDIATGLIKSFSFAWIITCIGVFRGLQFSGGAAGVGFSTTSSVVTSTFGIIALDCFWGLLFYMR